MSMKTRIIAILMTIILTLSLIPIGATAQQEDLGNASVTSIEIAPIVHMENVDGYMNYDRHWTDAEHYVDHPWFHYYIDPGIITIYYDDGSSISGTQQEIMDQTGIWPSCTSDQSYLNQWGIGTHTATIEFNGFASTYSITVVESNFSHISAKPLVHTDLFDAMTHDGYWDETADAFIEAPWIGYMYESEEYTVHYVDGSTVSGTAWEIYELTGHSISCDSDQSYFNQWGVGTHTATASLGGYTVEYPVIIQESPIHHIEVKDFVLTEWQDGWWCNDGYWNENDEWIDPPEWFYYYIQPSQIIVHYKDGSSDACTLDEFHEMTGVWLYCDSQQSYLNQWTLGEYPLSIGYGKLWTDFTVTIQPNPIQAITAETVECIVGLNGTTEQNGYWDENGQWIEGPSWFLYEIQPSRVTIHYANGTSFTGSPHEIFLHFGDYPSFQSDQSYENQWTLGEHTATIKLGGVKGTYTVKVIENPIVRIEAKPAVLQELFDGEPIEGYWDDENQCYVEAPWFLYNVSPEDLTVYLTDGRVLTGSVDDISFEIGVWPQLESDQSYHNQWEVGEHSATLRWGEAEVTYSITIVENGISHITVEDTECYLNDNGYFETQGYWNEFGEYIEEDTWYCYTDYAPENITIHYQDGTSATYTSEELGELTDHYPWCNSTQSYENQWTLGENTATLYYGGYSVEFTVTLKEFVMTEDHEHIYADVCDDACPCGFVREAPHSFSGANDVVCDRCWEYKYGMDFVYRLLKHIDGLDVGLTDEEADISGDGKINVYDAVCLLRILNGYYYD